MWRNSSRRLSELQETVDAPSETKHKTGHEVDQDRLSVPGEEFYDTDRPPIMATPTLHRETVVRDDCDEDDDDDSADCADCANCVDDGIPSATFYQGGEAGQGGDSPTLGRPQASQAGLLTHGLSLAETSDLPPLSAVTADTDGTMFDNEPQAEPASSSAGIKAMRSQIMNIRGSELDPSPALSEIGSEAASKDSIQMALRSTTYHRDDELPPHLPAPQSDHQRAELNEDNLHRWSTGSWTSSFRDPTSAEGPSNGVMQTPPRLYGRRRSQSLASPGSPADGGMTTPSTAGTDAGHPISHAVENEYGSGVRRQNLFGEIYQKILDQSPDLARQGGWDTQRVTQLCLQEIDRGKYERLSKLPSPHKAKRETTRRSPASSNPKSPRSRNHVQGHRYRASLNNAEDFALTSPSIVDWMQFAAADSPTDEGGGTSSSLPPQGSASSTPRKLRMTPQQSEHNGASAVGLNIHLKSSPQSPASRTGQPRPPSHSPPPLPIVNRSLDEPRAGRSPSIYENGPPSSLTPPNPFSPSRSQAAKQLHPLSRVPSWPDSTEALVASSHDSVSALSSSFLGGRLGLDQSAREAIGQRASRLPEHKKVVRRKHVIKELVDTEVSFGRDMSVVEDIYKGTSSSCLDLTAEDIRVVFGNSSHIVKFSMDFLDALKKAAKSVYTMPKSQRFRSQRTSRATSESTIATSASDDQARTDHDAATDLDKDRGTYIGHVFKRYLGELESVYTIYLKNHDAANRRLRSLQENAKVEIWLKECGQWAADLTNAWDLDSLLVKPVQRLLKYPLLLTQLLEATPEDHPDRTAIKEATHELTEISVRINEMRKHSELVEQGLRKRTRKESDVRSGFSKAIGRKTEKLKQNVGVSRTVDDREYAQIRERYTENLARLVLVREDVKNYVNVVRSSTQSSQELAASVDGWIDISHTAYPEKESKWRQYAMTLRELIAVAVPDHVAAVQRVVLDPISDAAKMLEALFKDSKGLIQRRDMKSLDYARYQNSKDRGEKLEKKITDRMEEWEALNREAKGRMNRLIRLTSHLAQGCLKSFIGIQSNWLMVWQLKLEPVIGSASPALSKISKEWQEDFDFHEAQVLTLGICNGSLLAEAVNLLSLATPSSTLDGASSPRQPSWDGRGKRSFSTNNSETSASVSHEFTRHHSGSFIASPGTDHRDSGPYSVLNDRMRARSTEPGSYRVSETVDLRESLVALGNNNTSNAAASHQGSLDRLSPNTERVSFAAGRSSTSQPPRLSLEAPSPNLGTIKARSSTSRPDMGPTLYSTDSEILASSTPFSPPSSSSPRRSTIATGSSASDNHGANLFPAFGALPPNCESPLAATPSTVASSNNSVGVGDDHRRHQDNGEIRPADVLFLAASVYEFNIDRSHREAGYPYLTYVTGEIFDVIGERGELWLARNQDDSDKSIGWIWNKHFVKVGDT